MSKPSKRKVCGLLKEASSALYYAYDSLHAGGQFENLSIRLEELAEKMKCPKKGKS